MDVAIVGAGGMGRMWAAAVGRSPLARLVALVDPLMGSAQQPAWVGDHPHVARAAELSKLDVEAVIITAISPAHAALVEQALGLGYHVLVEKPFVIDLAVGRRLVDLAERAGRTLMVGQNYRFFAGPQLIREAVRAGTYGKVRSVVGRFWCDWPPKPYQAAMAHPMLLEMAIHHLDLVRAVTGADAVTGRVREWNSARSPYRSGGGAVAALYDMSGGGASFPFLYSGSLISPAPRTPWPGLWRFEFDGATLLVDLVDGKYGVYRVTPGGGRAGGAGGGGEVAFLSEVEGGASFGLDESLRHFHACVAEGAEPWPSGRDNLLTLRMALGFLDAAPRV